jgi:hypothetical protein
MLSAVEVDRVKAVYLQDSLRAWDEGGEVLEALLED